MKVATLFLAGLVSLSVAASAWADFTVTGGTVFANASIAGQTTFPGDGETLALPGTPFTNNGRVAAEDVFPGPGLLATVSAVASWEDCLIKGDIRLGVFNAIGNGVGQMLADGSVTIGFTVADSNWYILDTYLSEDDVEFSEIRLDGVLKRAGVQDNPLSTPGSQSELVFLNAGPHVLVGLVNILNPANTAVEETELLTFQLSCVPEPSQYAMLGLAGLATVSGRYGYRRLWAK